MKAAQLERLQEHLQRLRLFKSRERLEALLQEATTKELSFADFLDQVLTEEVASKTAKHITMRTHLARFPFVKGLDASDSAQPAGGGRLVRSQHLGLTSGAEDLPPAVQAARAGQRTSAGGMNGDQHDHGLVSGFGSRVLLIVEDRRYRAST